MDIETESLIDAPRSTIWSVLIDVPGYNGWNPFLKHAGGGVAVGEVLRLDVHLPGAWVTPTKVRIMTVDPERELTWLGHFLNIPGLIDGYHSLQLFDEGHGQTKLVHKEHFEGFLLPIFFSWFTRKKIRQGMDELGSKTCNRTTPRLLSGKNYSTKTGGGPCLAPMPVS